MFAWYQKAAACLAWIDDFTYHLDQPRQSSRPAGLGAARWFTRGWTLRELLAARDVVFFGANWALFGSKQSPRLSVALSRITGIQPCYPWNPDSIFTTTVARRMSWAAAPKTTREEDMAEP